MKKLREAQQLLKSSEFSTKVFLYFAVPTAGEDYDSYEKNYTMTSLNPIAIKAIVREVSPSSLIFKEIGLKHTGAVEVFTEDKYSGWFENADRVIINNIDYQVYRAGTGGKSLVQKRPYHMMRIFLTRKD